MNECYIYANTLYKENPLSWLYIDPNRCNESITYLIVVTAYYNCIFPNYLSLPYLGISAGDSIQVTSQIKSPFVG
jgi:hypothetical protein